MSLHARPPRRSAAIAIAAPRVRSPDPAGPALGLVLILVALILLSGAGWMSAA